MINLIVDFVRLLGDKVRNRHAHSLEILKDNLEYELKASADGYAPSKETINVSEGSIADKNIQLKVAKGLYIERSDIPENGMVNMQYTATAKATNYTADNFAAGSYTAKLYVDSKAEQPRQRTSQCLLF